jgi:uncharacterized lipoprotein YehR (DUF1307 family)
MICIIKSVIMKTKYYLNLLMVLVLLITACKKGGSGGTDTPAVVKPKYLTRIIIVATGPAAAGSVVTTNNIYYTYDSKKRLSTVKTGANTTTYAYLDDGNLFSINTVNTDINTRTYTEFAYAEGKVNSYKSQAYNGNTLRTETVYTYVYNGDKATELHYDIYYLLFTYDNNGNLTRIFNHGSTDFTQVYSYDDKKNKFINAPFKYPLVGDSERLSPNNRVNSTTEGLSLNLNNVNTYVYDDEGYPTAGTAKTTNYEASSTYKYTYIYSTLDE